MHTLNIPGKPIAKARPRFFRKGKYVGTYNAQQTEEGKFLALVTQQWTHPALTGPLVIDCVFYMPRPKYHYGTGRNSGKLKPSAPVFHVRKPDTSNLVKFIEDCLNGVCWKDDSQIYQITATKRYGEEPRTEITIFEAE